MRWRYLILGVLCCIPVATAIYFWPQRPVFCVSNSSREYLGDDPASRELLFMRYDQALNNPPVLERWRADTGQVHSETALEIGRARVDLEVPNLSRATHAFVLSKDRSTVWMKLQGLRGETSDFLLFVAFFDAKTGGCRASFNSRDHNAFETLSPDGRWVARGLTDRIVVYDTHRGEMHCTFPFPAGASAPKAGYFSADSRELLWSQVKGEARSIELCDVDTAQQVGSFSLPPGHGLSDWRQNEIRTFSADPGSQHRLAFRHRFDGKTLGPGEPDPDRDWLYHDDRLQYSMADTDTWIAKGESYYKPHPADGLLAKAIGRLQSMLGVAWWQFKPTKSRIRLIDRRTNAVMYETSLPQPMNCDFALDGQILIAGARDVNAFQIYRTNGWPKWVWAAMGVVAVMLPFVWFARRRYKVLMRRRAALV